MRFDAIARVREQARALAQKARRTAVAALVLVLLAVSLIVGKNILLGEVGKGIRKTFAYDRLTLSYFPPALVIENFRSLTEPPAVRARRVRIEIPYVSLLRNRKILSVVIDSPEIHIRPPAAGAPRRKARPPLSILELPFAIESGTIENGTVIFERGRTVLEARGVRALITQDGDKFAIRATAASSGYTSPRRGPTSIGALTVLLAGTGENVTVDRLSVEGPGLELTASGLIRDFFRPSAEIDVRYRHRHGHPRRPAPHALLLEGPGQRPGPAGAQGRAARVLDRLRLHDPGDRRRALGQRSRAASRSPRTRGASSRWPCRSPAGRPRA